MLIVPRIRWTASLVALWVGACARLASSPPAETVDRSSSLEAGDRASLDGAPARCRYGTGHWRFGPVTAVSELNSAASETDANFSPDGLTIYFCSNRPGGLGEADLYVAARARPGAAFEQITALAGVNSVGFDGNLVPTADGLSAFLVTDRPGGPGGVDIWLGRRPSTAVPWSSAAFAPEPTLSTAGLDYDPFLSASGLRLYYAITDWPAGTGPQDLVVSERSSSGAPFGPPRLITGFDVPYTQADPTLTADEKVMIFSSDRPGGQGAFDLWWTSRSAPGAAFGEPAVIPGLNTGDQDSEPSLSPDGCELFFDSSRPGGKGGSDLYRVEILEGP